MHNDCIRECISFVDELSLFLYNHKNNPFAYAIIMHSGDVTQALKTATPYFAASADFSTELDPLTAVSKASAELMTHQNPVTGAYVSAKNAAILGGVGAAFGGMGKLAEFGLALRGAREVGLFGKRADFSIAGKYSVQYRTTRMLEKNVGYNVTPENVFSEFSQVGKNGTYVTDYQAIAEIIGPVRANTKIDIGLFTTRAQGRLSYFKVLRLERALGLKPGSLVKDSFRFSRITEITERHPRSPIDGNRFFQGAGKGLPGGGPELVIDSLPTNPWP